MGNLKANLAGWQDRRIGTLSPAPPHNTYIYCYSNDSIPRLIQINTDGVMLFRTLGKPVDTTEGKSFRGISTIYVS